MSTTQAPSVLSRVVLGIGIIAIFIAVAVVKCGNSPVPVNLSTHDTFYKERYHYDTIPGKVDIPTQLVRYIHDSIPDSSLVVQVYHDTVYISKHDTVKQVISPAFLTLFPTAPKLVMGDFSINSIDMNLLGTDGHMVTKQYNVDYSKYTYAFYNNELHTIPRPKGNLIQQMLNPVTTSSYLYAYYLPIRKGATIKLDYTIAYRRLGVGVFGALTTTATPIFEAGIGLRAQIK